MKFLFISMLTLINLCLVSCNQQEGSKSSMRSNLNQLDKDIPESIKTPAKVYTRIGELNFDDGRPDAKSVKKLYDNLDHYRGVDAFLKFLPMASLEGLRRGNESVGANDYNKVLIMENLLTSKPLYLTGNTDTVYASAFFDLSKTGPIVIEIPANAGPSTVNDSFFRFVTDLGGPGPDRGKGGKYLILPPDYQGDIKLREYGEQVQIDGDSYYVSRSKSFNNWFIGRGLPVNGDTTPAVSMWSNGLKIYPLQEKNNRKEMLFITSPETGYNTIHANNFDFYKEVNDVIQREHIEIVSLEERGLLSSIGIQKGLEFNPDQRMKKILIDSAKVGNATARAILFRPRNEEVNIYEDGSWISAFAGGSYQWLKDDGEGGRNFDARTNFFYMATVNTPAMVLKLIDIGSQYALAYQDNKGKYLDGGKTYKVNLPQNIPAKNFWSITIYDPQTRSELRTQQKFPSRNSTKGKFVENDDGSIDIYFSPRPPAGYKNNWIQTRADKGWFTILRLYGPKEEWYSQEWRPSPIIEVDTSSIRGIASE